MIPLLRKRWALAESTPQAVCAHTLASQMQVFPSTASSTCRNLFASVNSTCRKGVGVTAAKRSYKYWSFHIWAVSTLSCLLPAASPQFRDYKPPRNNARKRGNITEGVTWMMALLTLCTSGLLEKLSYFTHLTRQASRILQGGSNSQLGPGPSHNDLQVLLLTHAHHSTCHQAQTTQYSLSQQVIYQSK